ncbi:MAG: hypothetical protein KIT84_01515 [Labilithrix sp.]|nr:hypothetical protein [Labilithrix sp.]MCW5809665.1 hypothetical protein [Labilithrix sp.]
MSKGRRGAAGPRALWERLVSRGLRRFVRVLMLLAAGIGPAPPPPPPPEPARIEVRIDDGSGETED